MDREKLEYWFAVLLNNLTSGLSVDASLRNATIDMASVFEIGPPRCEHDVIDGNWCEACNHQMKDAAAKG
jgi:hypothetical protein